MPTITPTEERFERIDKQDEFFAALAAAGEGLVPNDPTLLEDIKKQAAKAVSGVALVSALHAAPAAASAPEIPTPIVRIANVGSATPTPAEEATPPPASIEKITHKVRVLGAEANIVAAAPVESAPDNTKLTGQRVIERGDTLSEVAHDLGLDLSHLIDENKVDMPDPHKIFSGQVADYDSSLAKPHQHNNLPEVTPEMLDGTEEVDIKWGDTLGKYQAERGDKVADIAARNRIPNPDHIHAGEKIHLKTAPAAFSAASAATSPVAEAAPAPPVAETTSAAVELKELTEPTALIPNPAPVEQAAPAPEMPPPPMSKEFNVAAIPDQFHGFGGQQIRQDMERHMDVHKLAANGASQLASTYLRVAGNDHKADLPDGRYGLIGAGGDLREGMGTESREAQIDLIIRRMQERRPDLYNELADRKTSPERARQVIDAFIGHPDVDGKRFMLGQHIAWYLHAEKDKPLQPPFSLEPVYIPSVQFNISAIPEDFFNQGGGKQIRADIYLMFNELVGPNGKVISPNGAAAVSATFLAEAGNDHRRVNPREGAVGLIQARFERNDGMPMDDRNAQIKFIFEQLWRDYPTQWEVLSNINSTPAQINNAIEEFIRYGEEGNRKVWAQQLAYFLHVPKGEAPNPTFSLASAAPPATAANTPPAPAPAPTPPPTGVNPPVAISANVAGVRAGVSAIEAQLPNEDRTETIIHWDTKRVEATGITTVVVGDGFRVNVNIAQNMEALINAAKADGVDLWEGDSFRTAEEQADRRHSNGCRGDLHSSSRKAGCDIPTAAVGESEHEDGEAIDFAVLVLDNDGKPTRHEDGELKMRSLTKKDREFQWLKANAHRFGFKNLPSEAWHWSTTGK